MTFLAFCSQPDISGSFQPEFEGSRFGVYTEWSMKGCNKLWDSCGGGRVLSVTTFSSIDHLDVANGGLASSAFENDITIRVVGGCCRALGSLRFYRRAQPGKLLDRSTSLISKSQNILAHKTGFSQLHQNNWNA